MGEKSNGNRAAAVKEDIFGMRLLTKPRMGPSGAFIYALGHHYDGKQECYDVMAAKMSVRPIQLTRRHHHSKEEALITWEETIKRLDSIEKGKQEDDDKKIILGRG